MHSVIQPVVLVGGRSSRFGRDKLREPIGREEWLVDRPIRALRDVFGARVATVGDCHPDVAARADMVLADCHAGSGPAGGILAALEQWPGDVFVLAGDLLNVTAAVVQTILDAAAVHTLAWAVWAESGDAEPPRTEPCIGLYRQPLQARLRERLARGHASLHDLVPPAHLMRVKISAEAAINLNTTAGLRAAMLPGLPE